MTNTISERIAAIAEKAAPGVEEWAKRPPAPPQPEPEEEPFEVDLPEPPRIRVPVRIETCDLPSRAALRHVLAAIALREGWGDFSPLTRGGHMSTERMRRIRDVAIVSAMTVGASRVSVAACMGIQQGTVTAAQGRVQHDRDLRRQVADIAAEALRAHAIRLMATDAPEVAT